MLTAHFEYRCRRCGRIFSPTDCDELLATGLLMHSLCGTPVGLDLAQRVPLTHIHLDCRRRTGRAPAGEGLVCYTVQSGVGVGDLIGYGLTKTEKANAAE